MNLEQQQRSLHAYLLGRSETPGRETDRWALYRSMVQGRIEDMIVAALPRFAARATQPELTSLVRRWLATAPLDSPLIRDLPGQFARWMADDGLASRDPIAAELVAVELAFWEVSFAPDDAQATRTAVDFAFELAPAINKTTRILRTRFRSHREERALHEESPCSVAIFRSPTTHLSRWRELTPLAEALLRRFEVRSNETASERVREVATALDRTVDGEFVAELSELLSAWIEDGLLLGSSDEA